MADRSDLMPAGLKIERIWRQDRPIAVARMEREGTLVSNLLRAEREWADYLLRLRGQGMSPADADSEAMRMFVYLPDDPERPVVRSFPSRSGFWDFDGILVVEPFGEGVTLSLKPDGSLTPVSPEVDSRLGPEHAVTEAVWRERAGQNYSRWRKRVAACA